jgi:hypothetical protein
MLRSEVIAGIRDLRYRLETMHSEHVAFSASMVLSDSEVEYFENVLSEATLAVLLNEQNDPHAPHMR